VQAAQVRRTRWTRWLAPGAGLILVAALGTALLRGNGEPNSPLIGKPAPAFSLLTLDGSRFELRQHLGRPVILNFWASWCVPCRQEAPLLAEFAREPTNLTMVGVIFSDRPDPARAFVKEFAVPYVNLLDPQSRVAIDYGVSGIPETFFIDAQGVVQEKRSGPLTHDALRTSARSIGVRF
jgi:cytochrome c biogenesis protein CcmG/thiol:disulfide interchange protein DsbE